MLATKYGLRFSKRITRKLLADNVKRYSNNRPAVIMGIETSCDDTGCAIVNSDGVILGEALHSQQSVHLINGGIIPPIAQDLHRQHITNVVENTLISANMKLKDIDAVAVTVKPGLPLSLQIGTKFGKYLSKLGNKPFIPIHHMEAHALTARMVEKVDFPFLVLLISGGHCLLAIARSVDEFLTLGSTIDDAPGEAFDKSARRLKLRNIPEFSNLSGGAAIEEAAHRATNPDKFQFVIPMLHYADCNFSLAGVKNGILRHILTEERMHNVTGDKIIPNVYNLCAGFQLAVTKHLCHRTQRAMEFAEIRNLIPEDKKTLVNEILFTWLLRIAEVVSGGAACNNFIAKCLESICSEMGYKFVRPPPKLCTDNGIMIAWNGVERWITDRGVLREREEIEKVDFDGRAPLGEDWREEVTKENIRCKWLKLPLSRIRNS